jgi:hypothetical protein
MGLKSRDKDCQTTEIAKSRESVTTQSPESKIPHRGIRIDWLVEKAKSGKPDDAKSWV